MAVFNAQKEVSALPATLSPNTVYFIRVGTGFELRCSDMTGTVAHTLNLYRDLDGGNALSVYANGYDIDEGGANG